MSHEINKRELDNYLTREPPVPSAFYEELYPSEPHCFHQSNCPVLVELLAEADRKHQLGIEQAKIEWIKALLKEGIMVAEPKDLEGIRSRLEEQAKKQRDIQWVKFLMREKSIMCEVPPTDYGQAPKGE